MISLDAEVRRVDEDRWLAARFASAAVRAQLTAIYALNHEIAKTAEVVSQSALGDIRLAWWREALAEVHAGKAVRAHPVLQAYGRAVGQAGLPHEPIEALIEARGKDLEPSPFSTWAELENYLDATAGSVLRLALGACAPGVAEAGFIAAAAQAWGGVGLLRAAPHWHARGRNWAPLQGGAPLQGEKSGELLARARAAYAKAKSFAYDDALFPACGYLALVGSYGDALERGQTQTLLIARQLKLVIASATGKL